MSKIANYFKGAREELAKVVWPSRETTTQHTLVVIGISVVVAVFLGGIDFLLNRVLQFLI
ncbi:preprotein translocase subunit SecE [Candidatus Parcubacteria bacterium]|jgi:preprotein translocase subunit SecE|nr:preprotein translocase subunit SecE [Candidatus Parcubacteria bacterium]